MKFESVVAVVFEIEGIESNDPLDPGGLTKFGISSKLHPEALRSQFSRTDALAIYRREYWDLCRCSELPDPLPLLIFDTAVNHGPPAAIRWLQTSLGITADGVIGAITIRAAQSASPDVSFNVLALRALNYAGDAGFSHFGRGWMRRLFLLESHMLKGL